MLRITRSEKDGTIWLRLEGKLLGPWVNELRTAVAQEASHRSCVRLDLDDVTFVDAEGLGCLRDLAHGGHDIPRRSSFVAELLRTEVSS